MKPFDFRRGWTGTECFGWTIEAVRGLGCVGTSAVPPDPPPATETTPKLNNRGSSVFNLQENVFGVRIVGCFVLDSQFFFYILASRRFSSPAYARAPFHPAMASAPSVAAPPSTVFPRSHVGFDSITSQIEKKLLKRGFQFNVMCVG